MIRYETEGVGGWLDNSGDALSLFAQTPAGPKPSFEVVLVKPNTTGDNRVMIMTVFTAVQEQLGLRLESTKGPIEVLLMDSVQKPTEN